jgi:hypothetical protein
MLGKPGIAPSFAEACLMNVEKRWKEQWLRRAQKTANW